MRRLLALAAPLAALVLTACQTVEEAPARSLLADATFSNVVAVPGLRYVALDEGALGLVTAEVTAALRVPGSATFDAPLVAADLDGIVIVCGTLSASDGASRRTRLPFVAVMAYDEALKTALLYALDGAVARSDAPLVISDGAQIRGFCLEEIGATLPGPTARPPAGATIPPLLPRPR